MFIEKEYDNIKEVVQKNKLTKELEKYNEDVAKYNKISSFIKDDFESKKEEFNKFFSCKINCNLIKMKFLIFRIKTKY